MGKEEQQLEQAKRVKEAGQLDVFFLSFLVLLLSDVHMNAIVYD